MPRKNVPNLSNYPYHITGRCINREHFESPLPLVWSIMEDYIFFLHRAFGIKFYCFVLMPNHFHMIVRSPESNLSAAMNYFMRETSRQITTAAGRINQTYGGRFHRSLIKSEIYFRHAYKYVYRNPVKAGLSQNVLDYPFSSLPGLLGSRPLNIPIEDNLLFNPGFNAKVLDWMNSKPKEEDEISIRLALRRREFELPKNKNSKCPNRLEIAEF